MKITVDPEYGTSYFYLSNEPVDKTVLVSPFHIADFDSEEKLAGFEVLAAEEEFDIDSFVEKYDVSESVKSKILSGLKAVREVKD